MSVTIITESDDSAIVVNAPPTFTPTQGGPGYSNIVSAGSGTTINFSATAIGLFDGNGNVFVATNVSISLQNLGTIAGANGIEAGSFTGSLGTANYYTYVIYNPTTKQVAATVSFNSNAPLVMPPGFTFSRRVNWFYASGGAMPYPWYQRNAQFTYQALPPIATAGSGLAFYSLINLVSPFASRVSGLLLSNNNTVQVTDNDEILVCQSSGIPGQCFFAWSFVPSSAALGIYYSSSSSGGGAYVRDWEDNL